MKLYIYEHCPFCCRARMIFALKGLSVDTEVVMEGDAETPLRLVGRKVLPVLQKPDGTHMAESMDIVRFVDGLTGSPIIGQAGSSDLAQWYEATWPLALKLFIPRFTRAQFVELSTPDAREAYRLREVEAFGDLEELVSQTPALLHQMNVMLEKLERLLAAHRSLNTDDFLIYPLLRSLSIVKGTGFGREARAYMKRMEDATGVPLLFAQAA